MSESEWLTWQIVDSAFPTGAFAHSFGLESAWQQGEVEDLGALDRFLRSSVLQAGYATLPLLNSAYLHPERLVSLDELCEVFLVNAVANRASRIQGRSLVATASRIWPSDGLAEILAVTRTTCAHVAPLTGATLRVVGLPLATAQRVAIFSAARAVLAAAVRLGMAGSFEAQRMQYGSVEWLEEIARRGAGLTAEDLAQTAPVIDILQGGHDRLYSRLFQS